MVGQTLRDARVLVTGARGFIGGHLTDRLTRDGASVIGISSHPRPPAKIGVTWRRTDLANGEAVRHLIGGERPDVIFHLAGRVTGAQSLENVTPTFADNLASTVHLLSAAAEIKVQRILLTGSMQEPDQADPQSFPCSPYAASKWACGGYARMFYMLYGLPVVIARPMMVYGPGQWDLTKLLPYVATSLIADTSPRLTTGTREMDWVFVDDVVDGLLAVAESSDTDGQSIDLGSGVLTSIRIVVEHLVRLIGPRVAIQFGAIPDRPYERPRAARSHDTERLIGWSAKTPLEDGLRQTVGWYRDTWSSLKPV